MRRINWLSVLSVALAAGACAPASHASPPAEGRLLTAVAELQSDVLATVGAAGEGHAGLDAFERDMIAVVNAERVAAGARPLEAWPRLSAAADYHTREMIRGDYFAHNSLNGWTFAQRLRRLAGARTAGEVMAYSYVVEGKDVSARAIMDNWLASAAHRDQILMRIYNRIGVSRRIGEFKG